MPLTVDQFTQRLTSSGVMSADDLRDWIAAVPIEKRSSDGEQLARELVKQRRLTAWQAQAIYQGKGASLTFGNYLILDKLGQGGMGMVLKAEHQRMKRVVALKVLSPDAVKTPDAVRRFEREVQAAAKLEHPNIVTAYDADRANNTTFLVMQFVDGDDLSAIVKKSGPMAVDRAVDCVLQAARGLEFAHQQGVIHRDIKPHNLLLGKDGVLKILDMGLARIEDPTGSSHEATLTGTGAVMGTIDYMSPEQALDTKTADARSDIYSLGCTLFYLVTGGVPYPADTVMKRLLAHRETPIPSLVVADAASVGADASSVRHAALDALFRKMVAKKPQDRQRSMTEVIAELQRCLTSPVTAPIPVVTPSEDTNFSDFLAMISQPGNSVTSAASQAVTKVTSMLPHSRATSADAATVQYREGVSDTDPQTLSSVTEAEELRRSGRQKLRGRNALLVSIGVLLLVLGVWGLFRTPQGTVRFEITDKLIEVTVGETGRVVKGVTEKDVRLPLGQHVLRIHRDDLAFDTDPFEVTKGENVPIKVERVGRRVRAMQGNTLLGHKESSRADAVVGSPPPPAKAPFNTRQARAHQEAWAKSLGVPVEHTNSIGMKFVLIPPGEFLMGSTAAEIEAALAVAGGDENWKIYINSEAPQHKVILTKPVYLGIHEVTQAEYEKVMGQNPSHFAPRGAGKEAVAGMDTTRHPVEMVTWNDVAEFCTKLSEREKLKPFQFGLRAGETVPIKGIGYRLATEAEWEFACRAGTTAKYWSGDKDEDLARAGWFVGNWGGRTHAVGELIANPFGLFDIHGNVYEWVQDVWEPIHYGQFQGNPALDPSGPINGPSSAGSLRVVRGGRGFPAYYCHASNRNAADPVTRFNLLGFRVSLVVDAVRQAVKLTGTAVPKPGATDPDRRAATYILSVGGRVKINEIEQDYTDVRELPKSRFRLTSVWVNDSQQMTDAGLAACEGCQHLIQLSLFHVAVGEAGLKSFRECRNLKFLQLIDTQVTDEALAHFKNCRQLTTVELSKYELTDAGIATFKDCKNLETLSVVATQFSDNGLSHFKECKELQRFVIHIAPMGDAGLLHLQSFPKLTQISLSKVSVTNAGLAALQKIPQLTSLSLSELPLDDAAVEPLKKLTKLTDLRLIQTKLTSAGIAELKKALPNCKIEWDDAKPADGDPVTNDDPDRRAATYILSVGGKVGINEIPQEYTDVRELPKSRFRLTSISVSDCPKISDAGLAACRGCQHLTQLTMVAPIGNAGLEPFRECKNLKVLVLYFTKVTDAGLAYFSGCRDLTNLVILEGSLVTDLGLANFKDCTKLESLGLSRLQMTEKGIGHFRDCQNLRTFSVSNSSLGDAAFAQLKSFPKLDQISFASDQVTNAGLATLPILKELTLLSLSGTQFDDAGVEHFKKLTKLTSLHLVQNKLTSAGLAELRKALPDCKIETDVKP